MLLEITVRADLLATSVERMPNATRQALEIAGATKERRLFPVACTRLFG
jgi:hypothetical protein